MMASLMMCGKMMDMDESEKEKARDFADMCEMHMQFYERAERMCGEMRRMSHDDHDDNEMSREDRIREHRGEHGSGSGSGHMDMDDLTEEEICDMYNDMVRGKRMMELVDECKEDMDRCEDRMGDDDMRMAMDTVDEEYLYMGKAMACKEMFGDKKKDGEGMDWEGEYEKRKGDMDKDGKGSGMHDKDGRGSGMHDEMGMMDKEYSDDVEGMGEMCKDIVSMIY